MISKPSAFREFLEGVKTLLQGFLWFRKRPKAMLLGLIPAAIVASVVSILMIVILFNISSITGFLAGFISLDMPNWMSTVMEFAIGIAVVGITVVVSVLSFTGLTLIVGDSFYTKIWEEVEISENGVKPDGEPTFVDGLKDGLTLVGKGVIIAIMTLLLALIPPIGGLISTILGFMLTGILLSDELTGRAMNARGISHKVRSKAVENNYARSIGFGVATQLCFMIPLGAVFAMPAAVVGSTKLAAHIGNFEENANV